MPAVEMLTINDLMALLKVSKTTAHRIAKQIGVTRVAKGAIRVAVHDYNDWCARNKDKAPDKRNDNAEAIALHAQEILKCVTKKAI